MGWDHQAMTSYQRQAFKDLYNTGRPNTLSEHTKIAVNALEAGGATTQQARSLVAESLWNLRSQGVFNFLFLFEEDDKKEILVSGKNITEISDGLSGELFTEDGWISRFSKNQ